MDVLTGMVVMSIVVAMVFYLLSATTGQAIGFQHVRSELNRYQLMQADLAREIDQAQRIEKIPGGFHLSSTKKSVDYVQSQSALLRIQKNQPGVHIDTLISSIESMHLVTHPLQRDTTLTQLVTEITIRLKIGEQPLNCYYYKAYGIAESLNQTLIHEF